MAHGEDRYEREKSRLELALRLIEHEARTGTIRRLTGFSDDRIRKLFDNYFKDRKQPVRRRRGKTPTQIGPLVNTTENRLESTYLVAMMGLSGALQRRAALNPQGSDAALDLGHRLCQAYENYSSSVPQPRLSFESAWSLFLNLMAGQELALEQCAHCARWYLYDALSLADRDCPVCRTIATLPAGKAVG